MNTFFPLSLKAALEDGVQVDLVSPALRDTVFWLVPGRILESPYRQAVAVLGDRQLGFPAPLAALQDQDSGRGAGSQVTFKIH